MTEPLVAKGKIVALCSLCGHEYARCFDKIETDAHMAEAHGMYFVPGSLRRGDPPRWVSSPHVARTERP